MTGAKPAAGGQQKSTVWLVVVTVVVVGVCVGIGIVNNDGGGSVVPPPTATERADTVAVLKRNAEAQDVCYGWKLQESTREVSVGSNLGDGVPVDDERCPRWVEVQASVTWTSESSELSDYASVGLDSSGDLDSYDLLRAQQGLTRFGLTDDVFIDDPGWAITRAAVVLPLLLAETGQVPPVPVGTAAAEAAPTPLPAAGNDIWRDRWGYLLAVGGLLLVTALLVTVGLIQRQRQRRARPGQ
ncbi:hypothetical protein [Micromonospora cathayae]|uniref:Uncharacterized protein n=1 Tax=Micromonospora cathayae TaxID=3028804 RepID=A0ABY7ZUQ7_9ACTN|nr:hypothetical protein [Micromonospora sp. HUAS 3]WDZ86141.1 hypothetical protein PVK37_06895 [Micromonospora sp. HUAS 3]